jgi:hypothetical protein
MANTETEIGVTAPAVIEQPRELEDRQATGRSRRDLMAPGHLYNPRTDTGIEWLPANSVTGEPGKVRLWSRQWNGKSILLGEALHHTVGPREYWYSLEFANSFPQVTHWWFGDAWTGHVRIWSPNAAGPDPESGAPMLMGWLRFGLTKASDTSDPLDGDDVDGVGTAALPWTVVLTSPPRVNTPLPPMAASLANLPLQLLLGEKVMKLLAALITKTQDEEAPSGNAALDTEVVLTSLVRREDLQLAFPTRFGSWLLDRLPDLTPREALCRVQGLEPVVVAQTSNHL